VSCAQRIGLSTHLGGGGAVEAAAVLPGSVHANLPNATVAPATLAVCKKLLRFMRGGGVIGTRPFLGTYDRFSRVSMRRH